MSQVRDTKPTILFPKGNNGPINHMVNPMTFTVIPQAMSHVGIDKLNCPLEELDERQEVNGLVLSMFSSKSISPNMREKSP